MQPIVIAHRGASGARPEHTLAAYALAIDEGADFIEPDLVPTRDGHLVCRHENAIGGTTDVASHPEFAHRRTTRTIDGTTTTDWFTEDFTLAELTTLRARERLPDLRPANTAFDGQFPIPTFAQALALAAERGVGIYPETKHPGHFRSLGLPLEPALAAGLARHRGVPAFLQSFEAENLIRHMAGVPHPRVQLILATGTSADGQPYADMLSSGGLREVAKRARAIGPDRRLVVDAEGRDTGLVRRAHEAGLLVHPWTYRQENAFLPARLQRGPDPAAHGDLEADLAEAFAAGVDGVFSDHPARAVEARRAWTARGPAS